MFKISRLVLFATAAITAIPTVSFAQSVEDSDVTHCRTALNSSVLSSYVSLRLQDMGLSPTDGTDSTADDSVADANSMLIQNCIQGYKAIISSGDSSVCPEAGEFLGEITMAFINEGHIVRSVGNAESILQMCTHAEVQAAPIPLSSSFVQFGSLAVTKCNKEG